MNANHPKTPLIAASVIAALIIGAALGYIVSERSETLRDAAAPSATAEREALYWHDPMVPGAKFDKPGKSPFMDMDLVPVYANEQSGAAVRIDPGVVQNLGVRLGQVEKRALDAGIDAVGAVSFDERLLEVVQARVTGYVTRLHVKAPLTRVKRGQPLLEILSPEWQAAQQDYLALLDAQSSSVHSIRDAARRRLTVLGVPEATISAIERTRKTDATTMLAAPITGVVSELAVRDGSAFSAGDPLVRINGLATVWANAQIPETQAALVPEGSQATARATAWPGSEFRGRVIALLPDVDPQTRTLAVRVALENPHQKLVPGMFVSLTLAGAETQPQLVVPSEAIIATGRRNV
ncbi:MAG: efflux RND transporter periplasmic adaptor subunit, partial [Steroidobacter sp.]